MQFQGSKFQRFAFAVALILVVAFGFHFACINLPFFSSDEDSADRFGQGGVHPRCIHDIQISSIESVIANAGIPIIIASDISDSKIETIAEIYHEGIAILDQDITSIPISIG